MVDWHNTNCLYVVLYFQDVLYIQPSRMGTLCFVWAVLCCARCFDRRHSFPSAGGFAFLTPQILLFVLH